MCMCVCEHQCGVFWLSSSLQALLEVNLSNIQASLAPRKETDLHGANQRHRCS